MPLPPTLPHQSPICETNQPSLEPRVQGWIYFPLNCTVSILTITLSNLTKTADPFPHALSESYNSSCTAVLPPPPPPPPASLPFALILRLLFMFCNWWALGTLVKVNAHWLLGHVYILLCTLLGWKFGVLQVLHGAFCCYLYILHPPPTPPPTPTRLQFCFRHCKEITIKKS